MNNKKQFLPLIESLNDRSVSVRLDASRRIGELIRGGVLEHPATEEVNNHVHTMYSFSPYSPSMAAFKAWEAGLLTVGIMDHDSVAGCSEMLDACREIGIASTVGFEMRVNMTDTIVQGRKINNPDSLNNAYIAIHGIPRRRLKKAARFIKPAQDARNLRNKKMVGNLNSLAADWGIDSIDFGADVSGFSMAREGGSITERHILFALVKKVINSVGKGQRLVDFINSRMGIEPQPKIKEFLLDSSNPHYMYDLLGVFKSTIIGSIYEQPGDDECMPAQKAVDFAAGIGAIPAYAYLGDVKQSPTGDKKAEKFEDDFLDELISEIKRLGFRAVTYMPPRNTIDQLKRIQLLCRQNDLMEISGVDINSSRQSFNCPELASPDFRHLADAAWAMIAHEKLTNCDEHYAFFSGNNILAEMPFHERLKKYAEVGRMMDHTDPESVESVARSIFKGSE